MTLLVAERVRKHYGDRQVLRGIDLAAEAGTVTCVIGPSGCGKSTLLNCLNLLVEVDDGAIFLDGREITDPRVDVDTVRRDIAIVFQSYNLFPHMSVLDNVTLAPRKVGGLSRAEATARAEALLERFGLADKAAAHPDGLSGGQQQRVALIRAVAMRPKVLLLDEVTSALDPQLIGDVVELIAGLKADGMTMVMATHEIRLVRDVADRVLFIRDGVVHEEGTPEELLRSPTEPATRAFLARHLAG